MLPWLKYFWRRKNTISFISFWMFWMIKLLKEKINKIYKTSIPHQFLVSYKLFSVFVTNPHRKHDLCWQTFRAQCSLKVRPQRLHPIALQRFVGLHMRSDAYPYPFKNIFEENILWICQKLLLSEQNLTINTECTEHSKILEKY